MPGETAIIGSGVSHSRFRSRRCGGQGPLLEFVARHPREHALHEALADRGC